MKRAVFMVILSLALQGFSQIKSGVYHTDQSYKYSFIDGKQDGGPYFRNGDIYIHITDNGFRIYKQEGDTGNSYPLVYMNKDNEGYQVYAVPPGGRLEFKDDFMVMFYNFDDDTGWYQNSTEWHKLKYIRKGPELEYE